MSEATEHVSLGEMYSDYFLDYAFDRVKELAVGMPTNTLVVKTTIDTSLQKAAEDAVLSHLRQYGRKDPASMSINNGNITPIATAGGKTSARIDAEANAAPDPNPPLDIPAKITAGIARAKKE